MYYSFDSDLAERYGVKEAIVLHSFMYWIRKNEANRRHFHDGRYWTYNSVKALEELFPFFTCKQIRKTIDSLVEQGALIKGNYNDNPCDRTLWYALGNCIYENKEFDLPEKANEFDQSSKTFTFIGASNITQVINTSNNTPLISPQGEKEPDKSGISPSVENVTCNKMSICPFSSEDFMKLWEMLLQQPKWKKKTIGALKMSAKRLKSYQEEFAKILVEDTIANGWQGVVFPSTEERYRKWQASRQVAKPHEMPRFTCEADKRAYYEGLLNGTIKR